MAVVCCKIIRLGLDRLAGDVDVDGDFKAKAATGLIKDAFFFAFRNAVFLEGDLTLFR